jgi:hypothetical protein
MKDQFLVVPAEQAGVPFGLLARRDASDDTEPRPATSVVLPFASLPLCRPQPLTHPFFQISVTHGALPSL